MLGNPPFVGKTYQDTAQKADLDSVMHGIKGAGVLDFVGGWYVKSARYVKAPISMSAGDHWSTSGRTAIRCAFVSTNSITQGEQVGVLWSWLLAQGIKIHFAHRTFRWSNEASGKAAVHCVIIGFSMDDVANKIIYEYEDIRGEPHAIPASNINPYLVDAPDIALPRRSDPICDVPSMIYGSKPVDDGNFLLSDEEKVQFLEIEPQGEKLLRRFMGAEEFLYNRKRWCLWLKNASPADLRLPEVRKRIQGVKEFRKASKKEATRDMAAYPTLFAEDRHGNGSYLVVPEVSSERRSVIPIGQFDESTVQSNLNYTLPHGGGFEFGVLTSSMHNAWVRYTCGRLKSDFRYSAGIVYNNFPWPESPTDAQKQAIEAAAQGILDARAAHPKSSLADLYDPLTMPPDLVKAHQRLDVAVDAAYAKSSGKKSFKNDAERVAFLFELYQKYTSLLPVESSKPRRARKSKASN